MTESLPEGAAPVAFFEVARRPRMIGLLFLFLAAAAVCGLLGSWQLGRAHERATLASAQAAAEQALGGPEPLASVLTPQSSFPGDAVGRTITASGSYEPAGQLLVPGRTVDGREGFLVLTPFRVSDDGAQGTSWQDLSGPPVLPVVRGWAPDADAAAASPAAPGNVTLVAYLQAGETADAPPTSEGTVQMISPAQLVGSWGGPIYAGYAVLNSYTTAGAQVGDLVSVPRPQVEGGSGLNLQNLFYAVEWWVFGGFAVALWIRLVRDGMRGKDDPLAVPTAL